MLLSPYLNKSSFEKWKASSLWDLISQVENSSTLLSAIARVETRALCSPVPLVLLSRLSSLPLASSTSLMLQEHLELIRCLLRVKAIPSFPNHSFGFSLRSTTKVGGFFRLYFLCMNYSWSGGISLQTKAVQLRFFFL